MRILEKAIIDISQRQIVVFPLNSSFGFFLPELRHNFKELPPRISICNTGTLFLPQNPYVNYAYRFSVSLEYFPHRSMGNMLSKSNLWVGRSILDQVLGG